MAPAATGNGVTVIVTSFDVAGLPVAQLRFEVINTLILSPLARDASVYVALFNPTGVVPLYHW